MKMSKSQMKKEAARRFNEDAAARGYVNMGTAYRTPLEGVKELFSKGYECAVYIQMTNQGVLHGCNRSELENEYHASVERAYSYERGYRVILMNSQSKTNKVLPESAIRALDAVSVAPGIKAAEVKGGHYKHAFIFFKE